MARLVVAEREPDVPAAFMGVEDGRLEMLLLSPADLLPLVTGER